MYEPATQFLNIVIRPSVEVSRYVTQWSKLISENYQCNFVVDEAACFAHLTLYQAEYPTKNIPDIKNTLAKIARSLRPFTITLSTFKPHAGFVFYVAQNSKPLLALHQKIVTKLNPLREGIINEQFKKMMGLPEMKDTIKANIEKFGSPNVHEVFRPHITVTRLTNFEKTQKAVEILKPITLTFDTTAISLGICSTDGICPQFLASFQLIKT